MTLVHFLALFGLPPALVSGDGSRLPLSSGETAVTGGRPDPALVPGIRVRGSGTVLQVRGPGG